MFRKIFLILFLCGLTGFSVLTEDRGSAETYACQVAGVCRFPETPPSCETNLVGFLLCSGKNR